jgi:PAS domain S-box-containing protein
MLADTLDNNPVILNVDDHDAGRYAVTRILTNARFRVREAATGSEALRIVADESPDLVLLDVNLPDMNGFEVCRRIKDNPATARIPVLHITASSLAGADRARGLEGGAENYLIEPVEPEVLVASVRAALRARRAEEAMRAMAQQWQSTFDSIADGIALLDSQGRIVRWNHSLERLLGKSAAQLRSEFCYNLWDSRDSADRLAFERAVENLRREEMEKQQGPTWYHVTLDPVLDETTRAFTAAVYIVSDVTDRKRLEEQFRQAQRFESIGQLAGGVAHDFNNLLTSILGNASLVLGSLPPASPDRANLEEVVRASNRAAELTRQLLAYSGKGRFVLKRLDLSLVVQEVRGLVESSIENKKIQVRLSLDRDLPPVEADPSQMQQLLLNLVSNAAEAIGDESGVVTITTASFRESGGSSHVSLEVSDTGCGMDEAVRAHIFEPFFTTKFFGRGLGLSAVAGIVRGHKGSVQVESTPGRGSAFRVVLPAIQAEPAPLAAPPAPQGPVTVLVVDDEEMVRRMAKAALEIRGYRVLLAENGLRAVETLRDRAGEIGIVLLDVTMPVMDGREAAEHIARISPGIRIVASSGYDQAEAARRFGRGKIMGFLQKPYTSRQLAEKIKAALETRSA